MAKTPKNATKVKTGLRTYDCTWTYGTPMETWSNTTFIHNVRYGILPVIKKLINDTVRQDEINVVKNQKWLELTMSTSDGSEASMARINAFCAENNIKTVIQTEYVIWEADCMAEVEEPEDE